VINFNALQLGNEFFSLPATHPLNYIGVKHPPKSPFEGGFRGMFEAKNYFYS